MYKGVYVPVDNSDYSNQACVIGVDVARTFGGRVAGCHAYAAKMHDVRFRQMESGLPEEFRDEDEMKRQRKIHDQLITKGLEIITDSYIDVLEPLCEKYGVELVRRRTTRSVTVPSTVSLTAAIPIAPMTTRS